MRMQLSKIKYDNIKLVMPIGEFLGAFLKIKEAF